MTARPAPQHRVALLAPDHEAYDACVAESRTVIIAAALIGAVATLGAALIAASAGGDGDGSSSRSGGAEFTLPDDVDAQATVFLSRDSGPGGTSVNVSGEGFAPGERVVIRFHTEQIGSTTASGEGSFANVSVEIPTSFSQFAPQQFGVVATGEQSVRSGEAPFTITG
jgi:hypothetical protein